MSQPEQERAPFFGDPCDLASEQIRLPDTLGAARLNLHKLALIKKALGDPTAAATKILELDPGQASQCAEDLRRVATITYEIGGILHDLATTLGLEPINQDDRPSLVLNQAQRPILRIGRENCFLLHRLPSVEIEANSRSCSVDDVLDSYRRDYGEVESQVRRSRYLNQKKALDFLRDKFPENQRSSRANRDSLREFEVLVCAGGDDHFKRASHLLDGSCADLLILPIRTENSEGNLLRHGYRDIDKILDKLERGEYSLSPWTRILVERCKLNGDEVEVLESRLATSEILIARKSVSDMFGSVESTMCPNATISRDSGIFVATGAGITPRAWMYNYLKGQGVEHTDPRALHLWYARREAMTSDPDYTYGFCKIGVGESKLLTPRVRGGDSCVYVDALSEGVMEVRAGESIRITIGQPLWVIEVDK